MVSYLYGSDELEIEWAIPPRGINKPDRLLALDLSRSPCDNLLDVEDNLEHFDNSSSKEISAEGFRRGLRSERIRDIIATSSLPC